MNATKKSRSRAKALKNRSGQIVVRGNGDYSVEDRKDIKQIAKTVKELESRVPKITGAGLGRSLGNLVGFGDLGEKLGRGAATILGMGDYTVKGNSLIQQLNNPNASIVPVFDKNGRRGVRVTEREYINPTNSSAFPWLSVIAKQFEQWEPHGIIFQFVSTSSDFNGTGQALGTVIMATDYDVYDALAATKVELENMDYAQSTKPSASAIHGIECDPSERTTEVLYVGEGGPDQRFNTLGNFQIATQGMTGTPVVGELWVSYDITFYKKQLSGLPDVAFQCTSALIYDDTSSILGSATITAGSTQGFEIVQIIGSSTDVHFPASLRAGTFMFVWTCDAAPSNIDFNLFGINCDVTDIKSGFALSTTQSVVYTGVITLTGPGAYIRAPITHSAGANVKFTLHAMPTTFA